MTAAPRSIGVTGKRVLAVYGHPDDEGQVTGTIAALIAAGNEVTLVCATRGEVGEISDPTLSTPDTLWYTREIELRAAMAQIGLADVRFLPFRDSGMDGTPENADTRSLHQQPVAVAVPAILAIMREVRPHFVFTWQPDGGYGHPDHIAVHHHTLAAFDACADANAFPEAGPSWTPERLYWGARTSQLFATFRLEMERRGLLPEPLTEEAREVVGSGMACFGRIRGTTCQTITAMTRSSSTRRQVSRRRIPSKGERRATRRAAGTAGDAGALPGTISVKHLPQRRASVGSGEPQTGHGV